MPDQKTLEQIEKDAEKAGEEKGERIYNVHEYWTCGDIQNGYTAGATAYATKSAEREKIAMEALEKIKNNFDHEDYGDKNENCPVCIATFALEKLKAL